MKKILLIVLFYCFTDFAQAQIQSYIRYSISGKDTIPTLYFSEVKISDRMGRKGKKWHRYMSKLARNLKIVMPYAKILAARLESIDSELAGLPEKHHRKEYLKREEEVLRDKFEQDLRKFTYSQARLMIKLVDRETKRTSYTLIREYKNGITAMFWQSFATVFGMNLKTEYNTKEEEAIEYLIKAMGYE
jgi:hypothetical protein